MIELEGGNLRLEPKSNTVAEETAIRISQLADRMQQIAERINFQMRPYRMETPADKSVADTPDREYPPYFNQLRIDLCRIERVAECLEKTMGEVAVAL